jgi:hypothetical protein
VSHAKAARGLDLRGIPNGCKVDLMSKSSIAARALAPALLSGGLLLLLRPARR